MRSDSGEIRARNPAGFPNGLNLGYEGKITPRFSPEHLEGWSWDSTGWRKSGILEENHPLKTQHGNHSLSFSFKLVLPLVRKPASRLLTENKNDIIQYNLPLFESPENFEPSSGCCWNFWYFKGLKRIKDTCFHSCTRRMVENKYIRGFALVLEKYGSKCNVSTKVGRKKT